MALVRGGEKTRVISIIVIPVQAPLHVWGITL
jgi:hypothetical protein